MSLYGAMITGVSSLNANGRALGIASNNISNVNTVGYKTSSSMFATMLATTAQPGSFSPGGVNVTAQQSLAQQGLLQSTASATDLAVSGNGFFIVSASSGGPASNDSVFYTRAGSFVPDGEGYLVNSSGYYLLGWELDDSGALPANRNELTTINLYSLNGTAEATTEINLRANLQASESAQTAYTAGDMTAGTVTPHFERTLEIYDSQGGAQPVKISFVKTAANSWAYEVTYEGDAALIGGAANNPIATGTVTFNTDGTLATPATGSASFTIPWDLAASGFAPQAIALGFGSANLADGMTQFDSPSTLLSAGIDGALFGNLSGVSIDDNGYVTALFDNGIRRKVFKIPLATFLNPNGLAAASGNAYLRTDISGAVTILEAKSGGAGSIASSSLEASTVDLAKEFTDLITTQRAYSAATRIITTSDQMLEELLMLKR